MSVPAVTRTEPKKFSQATGASRDAQTRRAWPAVHHVGVFVAADHNYIHHHSIGQIVSTLLAIVLWPLILLFNVNLHIH